MLLFDEQIWLKFFEPNTYHPFMYHCSVWQSIYTSCSAMVPTSVKVTNGLRAPSSYSFKDVVFAVPEHTQVILFLLFYMRVESMCMYSLTFINCNESFTLHTQTQFTKKMTAMKNELQLIKIDSKYKRSLVAFVRLQVTIISWKKTWIKVRQDV